MKKNNKIIKQDKIKIGNDIYFISTVDLGMNHDWTGLLDIYWETMIFKNGDYQEIYQRRYTTKAEAKFNHNFIVDNLKYLFNYNESLEK